MLLASHSVWFHASLVRTAMATYPVETCDGPMNEAAPDALVPLTCDEEADETTGRRGCMKTLWTTTLAPTDERPNGCGTRDGPRPCEPHENLVVRGTPHDNPRTERDAGRHEYSSVLPGPFQIHHDALWSHCKSFVCVPRHSCCPFMLGVPATCLGSMMNFLHRHRPCPRLLTKLSTD